MACAVPWIIMVTVVSLLFKRGLASIVIVIGCFGWMEISRLVRTETMAAKTKEYVHYAERIGVMYLGSMVELGTSEEVFENPLHPYTKALIFAIPIADPELGRKNQRIPIQGELPSPMNAPKGCRFCTRCPYATDKCRQERPEFREIQPGHFARYHIL